MTKQKKRYTKTRITFLVLFLLSGCLAIILFFTNFHLAAAPVPPSSAPGTTPPATAPGHNWDILAILGTGASCLTAIVTFVGFVFTSILSWRKAAGENKFSELERQQKELEIEKQRLELEKLRAEQEKKIEK